MKITSGDESDVDDSLQQIDQIIERYMVALEYLKNK